MDPSTARKSRLKVGELAHKTGKSVRALRLYEELGLLEPNRSGGGFRLYGPDQIARVDWIAKLQDLGFSLAEIQALQDTVDTSGTAPEAMEHLRAQFHERLATTRAQLEKLHQLERDLTESLAYLEGCRSCSGDHAVAACASCDSVQADTPAPLLVAGAHRADGFTPGTRLNGQRRP